ncbi:MAG TPA: hypothetical protein VFV37_11720 [Luteibaculaceae bacterium]|nr:hypothetical protein [Luteibaculaceae bacterium]
MSRHLNISTVNTRNIWALLALVGFLFLVMGLPWLHGRHHQRIEVAAQADDVADSSDCSWCQFIHDVPLVFFATATTWVLTAILFGSAGNHPATSRAYVSFSLSITDPRGPPRGI